ALLRLLSGACNWALSLAESNNPTSASWFGGKHPARGISVVQPRLGTTHERLLLGVGRLGRHETGASTAAQPGVPGVRACRRRGPRRDRARPRRISDAR